MCLCYILGMLSLTKVEFRSIDVRIKEKDPIRRVANAPIRSVVSKLCGKLSKCPDFPLSDYVLKQKHAHINYCAARSKV
jgi:hypothetical protein